MLWFGSALTALDAPVAFLAFARISMYEHTQAG